MVVRSLLEVNEQLCALVPGWQGWPIRAFYDQCNYNKITTKLFFLQYNSNTIQKMIFMEQYNYNTITAYHIVIQYNSQYN